MTRITYNPTKRESALAERSLDFNDAPLVFAGRTLEFIDERMDYQETRRICVGTLATRMVIVGYVQRGDVHHIFSMRKAMSANKSSISSDLSKVDAHVIASNEYDDLPELSEELLAQADEFYGGVLVKRGRPCLPQSLVKTPVSVRLSGDVLGRFKASGKGWQTRMDLALQDWLKTHDPKELR
jgi:uncharacterized protein